MYISLIVVNVTVNCLWQSEFWNPNKVMVFTMSKQAPFPGLRLLRNGVLFYLSPHCRRSPANSPISQQPIHQKGQMWQKPSNPPQILPSVCCLPALPLIPFTHTGFSDCGTLIFLEHSLKGQECLLINSKDHFPNLKHLPFSDCLAFLTTASWNVLRHFLLFHLLP